MKKYIAQFASNINGNVDCGIIGEFTKRQDAMRTASNHISDKFNELRDKVEYLSHNTTTNEIFTTDPITGDMNCIYYVKVIESDTKFISHFAGLKPVYSYSEALEIVNRLELADMMWVAYAAVCIHNGIDYRNEILLDAMKNEAGFSYDEPEIEMSEWMEVYREIDGKLSDKPTAEEIYATSVEVQHEEGYMFAEEYFALVLCCEYRVEYNEDEFRKVFNEYNDAE